MALPTSGTLTQQQINAEFGAPVNTPLTAMVRGGAYVPNTAANAGVPTAPPISMLDFYGASAAAPVAANLTDHTVLGYAVDEPNEFPPPAVIWSNGGAQYYLRVSGLAQKYESDGVSVGSGTTTTFPGEWLTSGSATDCEARATLLSGTLDTADAANHRNVVGTWQDFSKDNYWTKSANNAASAQILVEVRNKVTLAVLDSATITLQISR